jgi:hypothetical protein
VVLLQKHMQFCGMFHLKIIIIKAVSSYLSVAHISEHGI